MEYLQYTQKEVEALIGHPVGFKPCYKWNTFNTWSQIKPESLVSDVF